MRLERMTVCLEGRCSIQLSYRTDLILLKAGWEMVIYMPLPLFAVQR